MTRVEKKRRCTAMTSRGRRCRRWASRERGSRGPGTPALCGWHRADEAGQRRQLGRRMPAEGRRCTVLTKAGERCRNWTMEGERVCAEHRKAPWSADMSRCTARTATGRRCFNWAWGDKQLCALHEVSAEGSGGGKRRCVGLRKDGRRCRRWAMHETRDDDQPLCYFHKNDVMPGTAMIIVDPDSERRCTATTASGARCRMRAVKDSEARWGGVLCVNHGGERRPRKPGPGEWRCTATTVQGERCTNWAMADSDPPLCWTHAYPEQHPMLRHGFYARLDVFGKEAREAVQALEAEGRSLEAQRAAIRIRLAAALAYVAENDLSLPEWRALTRRVKLALWTLARLEEEGDEG